MRAALLEPDDIQAIVWMLLGVVEGWSRSEMKRMRMRMR